MLEPVTLAVAGGAALIGTLIAYYELHGKKLPLGVTSGPPSGGWAQPPAAPGYTAPPAPAGVPPSWTYQGPPVAPATPTGKTQSITLAPGTMSLTAPTGTTLTINLPAGARWGAASDPKAAILMPTSIGGDITGGDTGDSKPAVLTGMSGAGTAQIGWYDGNGALQSTMLNIQSGAPTGFLSTTVTAGVMSGAARRTPSAAPSRLPVGNGVYHGLVRPR